MKAIYKWKLERPGEPFTLGLQVGYRIVHAGLDGGLDNGVPMPCLWAEVIPSAEISSVKFLLVPTGQPYQDEWVYLHTLNVAGYFFHLLSEC